MNKILFSFFILLMITMLLFICYFYKYLFRQYAEAQLSFHREKIKRERVYKTTKKLSQRRVQRETIEDNVTVVLDKELINKKVGYASLQFLDEDGNIERTQTLFHHNFSIGREDSNDMILGNKTISRKQCVIVYQNKQYFICNLSETNPTKLNGKRVENTHILLFGDVIEVPNYKLRFSDVI